MSRLDRAAQEAASTVGRLLRDEWAMKQFTVDKFGRHRDGYLHARVLIGEEAFYVHRRFGSWMLPGAINGRHVLREVLAPYNVALQERARPFERAERDHEARLQEAIDAAAQAAREATDAVSDDQAAAAAGVPEEGGRSDDR
jgi:hypothetical protein